MERDVQHLARLRSAMQVDPLARAQLAALWGAEVSRLTGQSDAAAWHRAAELHDQLGRSVQREERLRFGAAVERYAPSKEAVGCEQTRD